MQCLMREFMEWLGCFIGKKNKNIRDTCSFLWSYGVSHAGCSLLYEVETVLDSAVPTNDLVVAKRFYQHTHARKMVYE